MKIKIRIFAMNINIYLKELKRNRTPFIVWSIIIAVLISWGLFFYPVLMEGDTIKQMTTLFENPFMKGMMAAFGADVAKFTNLLGFYATYNGIYFTLLGSIYSILFAARVVAKEEHERTAEFLLTKPVTRIEVMLSKLLAWLTYLFGLNLIIVVTAFIGLEMVKGDQVYPVRAFLIMSCYSFLLMVLFGTIGLFLSILMKRGRSITSVVLGIVLGEYFIDAVSKITRETHIVGYLSPFKFVDNDVLRAGYGFEWWRLLYLIGFSLVLAGFSMVIYKKKDILV
jgi:ABC-2 type transport system permease protein